MAYIYDIADVWAASGTVFTGIKLSVTDTASAAGSLLMDLQVGGVSQFSVGKAGQALFANGSASAPSIATSRQATTGFYSPYSGQVWFVSGGAGSFQLQGSGIRLAPSNSFAWYLTDTGSSDLILARDAANTLAQRNGVNAQAFNLYNTYTDASNYERGFMRFVSNVLEIGMEKLGTGSNRPTRITSPGGNLALQAGAAPWEVRLTTAGHFGPASGNNQDSGDASNTWRNMYQAGFKEYVETTTPAAPAANRVRIYAEDNGSGKTRLMALFATGAAQQIAIEP